MSTAAVLVPVDKNMENAILEALKDQTNLSFDALVKAVYEKLPTEREATIKAAIWHLYSEGALLLSPEWIVNLAS